MKSYFTAHIEWIAYENGGRRCIPPQGTRYCPLIRLYEKERCGEWSIDFICPDFNETDLIDFVFLAQEAPSGLVELNKEYDIFEGAKKVEKIRVFAYEQ